MYRLVIEHPKWIPDAWQKQLGNLRAGENQGRIYRVRPKGVALRAAPRLDRATTAELVAALESPSGLVRDLAQQQLTWRGEKSAAPALEHVAADAMRPQSRAQALWTLQTLGALKPAVIERALRDTHPGVRRQAVRLSEIFAETNPELLRVLVPLAGDPDAPMRQQLAYTLGEWKQSAAGVALAQLVRADEDRFVRAAALSSALPHADTLLAQLSANGRGDDPIVLEVATATENARALASLLAAIASAQSGSDLVRQFTGLAQLLDWLQRNNKSLAQLQSASDPKLRDALAAADRVFDTARAAMNDASAPIAQRVAAVQVLGRGRARQQEDWRALADLLQPQTPIELQLAVVTALGRAKDVWVATHLLTNWNGYGPRVRAAVLDLLLSRPAWAQALLDRVEADAAVRTQIDAAHRLMLSQHSNPRVAERAGAIFSATTNRDRQVVIDRYLAAMPTLHGDSAKGAAVFATICSACHKFGHVAGQLIGPDLAAVKDRSAGYLVTHILDPNRAVEARYVLYTGATQDGRALAGAVANEAANSITLIGLDGAEQVILRSELRSLTSTGRSLMPDGLEGAINEQAMADLIAFLAGDGERTQGRP
jgi:putative heme-binding domain-containing protein